MRTKKQTTKVKTPATIRQWLLTLRRRISRNAIVNVEISGNGDFECNNLQSAIGGAFVWDDTDQKHDYWSELAELAQNNPRKITQERYHSLFPKAVKA